MYYYYAKENLKMLASLKPIVEYTKDIDCRWVNSMPIKDFF